MKKVLAAGTSKTAEKAPNKTGAYIDVQKRSLGTMKCGGKVKKGK